MENIDKRDISMLSGLIGRLSNQAAMNKAIIIVLLKEVRKLTGSDTTELKKSIESIFASEILQNQKILNDLVKQAFDEDFQGEPLSEELRSLFDDIDPLDPPL